MDGAVIGFYAPPKKCPACNGTGWVKRDGLPCPTCYEARPALRAHEIYAECWCDECERYWAER